MSLKNLKLSKTRVKDFSVLSGFTLESLEVKECVISTMDDINGRKLRNLDIADTGITDISTIGRMPELNSLKIDRLNLSSLAPLSSRKLNRLDCRGFNDNHLKVISQMSGLKYINISKPSVTNIPMLFGIPGLRSVNSRTLAQWGALL